MNVTLIHEEPPLRATPNPATEAHPLLHKLLLRGDYGFDPFADGAADHLWERPSLWLGPRDGITDDTGNRRFRLKDALKAHPWIGLAPSGIRQQTGFRNLIFSQVIVGVNPGRWEKHAMENGAPIKRLSAHLAKRHETDFGRRLDRPGVVPRYVCQPLKHLNASEVLFMFGSPVYVPDPEEEPVGEIQIQVSGGTHSIRTKSAPEWVFFVPAADGLRLRRRNRPVGLYAEQRNLLIAGTDTACPIMSPAWLGNGQGHVFIDLEAGIGYGDGIHLRKGPIRCTQAGDNQGRREFRFEAAVPPAFPGGQEVLVVSIQKPAVKLRVEPAEPPRHAEPPRPRDGYPAPLRAAARPKGPLPPDILDLKQILKNTWNERAPERPEAPRTRRVASPTVILDGPVETARASTARVPYALRPIAVALPRISGFRRDNRLDTWKLAVATDGTLAAALSNGRKTVSLSALAKTDGLFALYPDATSWRAIPPLTRPTRLGDNTLAVELMPPPDGLANRFHGLVMIRDEMVRRIDPATGCVLGRHDAGEPDEAPDLIGFGLLDQPDSIRFENGTTGTLECLNLSRRHLRLVLREGRLVTALERPIPAWRLDSQFRLVSMMGSDRTGETVFELGEHLLVGCYVLRFEGPEPTAAEAT